MHEILRLVNARQQLQQVSGLRRYNLEVVGGDIMVVYGLAGGGIKGLRALLEGGEGLSEGRIYIDGKPAPTARDNGPQWKKIYVCRDIRSQFPNLTVAENLDILSRRHALWQTASRRRILERARRYLDSEGIPIDPEAKVGSLSYSQRICLNLLQAKMAHAELVVMDCTGRVHGADSSDVVTGLMRRMSREGMAFLLLSYREDVYFGLASRIQKIAYGVDIMEWREFRGERSRASARAAEQSRPMPGITGIWDEWVNYAGLHEYLQALVRQEPAYWEANFGFPIPAEGCYCDGRTVLIPRESAWSFPENLTVADNLILPIPDRIGKGLLKRIPDRVTRSAAGEFCRITGVSPQKHTIAELSLLERKLLSLYRWEQARPAQMVLQNPHFGLDREESRRLDDYLRHLAGRGVRVIILSASLDNLKLLCSRITSVSFAGKAEDLVQYSSLAHGARRDAVAENDATRSVFS